MHIGLVGLLMSWFKFKCSEEILVFYFLLLFCYIVINDLDMIQPSRGAGVGASECTTD